MTFWNLIKFFSVFTLFSWSTIVKAQPERFNIQRLAFHDKIDQKQRYLDILDGQYDETITFRDPIITQKATNAYIHLIDSIQLIIEDKNTDGSISYGYLVEIFGVLNRINSNNYHLAEYFENRFENISNILKHKDDEFLLNYLLRDVQSSITNIIFFRELPIAENFLLKAAHLYPNEVLKEINSFSNEPYALKIVEEVARVSPMAIKKYFNSKNMVNTFVVESQDSVVNLITDLFYKYGNESKVYFFIDMIKEGTVSPDLMHSVSKYPLTYLNALIRAKQKDHLIGDYDVERELSVKALEEVRKVNDLHDLTDMSKRFAAVKDMGASELYTLIVYSPEEIFTSTFNGLFERLLNSMKAEGMNGYLLLEQIHFNKFRTFVKLCAGYNSLEKFLSTMPEEQAVDILRRFVSELNADDGNISEAVNVADTFGSLDNPDHLKIFDAYLKEEYAKPENTKDTKVLYGLLLKLLFQKTEALPDSVLSVELQQYPIPPVDQISIESLSDSTGTTQMHFFFDDDDGLTSYHTFIAAFKSAGFSIQDFQHYVVIKNKGKHTTTIYANKPLSEREGQAILVQMVQEGIIHPTVIVHRGHSYYAMNTISQIPNYAKVVFLGSCGGYHNISEVIHRAPQAHIIASKQIGTYIVNNNLLVEMSKLLRDQDQLTWATLWATMNSKLKGSGKSYERFLDYVPPHKNLGAIFIQSYNRITREEFGQ
ncbi:MAG TPA: hypothetical protein VLZ75_00755 [Chitinophagales bacterium]|nr:hypothetical protein [Chitinophagales bacterium]